MPHVVSPPFEKVEQMAKMALSVILRIKSRTTAGTWPDHGLVLYPRLARSQASLHTPQSDSRPEGRLSLLQFVLVGGGHEEQVALGTSTMEFKR